MYGHVEKLAEEIQKGAASVEGVEAKLWQVWSQVFLTSNRNTCANKSNRKHISLSFILTYLLDRTSFLQFE